MRFGISCASCDECSAVDVPAELQALAESDPPAAFRTLERAAKEQLAAFYLEHSERGCNEDLFPVLMLPG